MARSEPSFFLLDGPTGRRTATTLRIAVDRDIGLRLVSAPEGPLGLRSADGTLGGLRMPRGMALDASGLLHLLAGSLVLRFDPRRKRFFPIPWIGDPGSEPRQLSDSRDVTIAGSSLYVADTGNARVQVFDLHSGALVHLWGAPGGETWQPWAVDVSGTHAYILDRENGRVYRHRAGTEPLDRVLDQPSAAGAYGGLAIDRQQQIYVLDTTSGAPQLQVFSADGDPIETVTDAGQLRSRFEPPSIRKDHRGRFCLPQSLAHECDRRRPASPSSLEDPLGTCRQRGHRELLFDARGRRARLDPEELPGPPIYARTGIWWSQPLDSEIHRCQWHRIELGLPSLPPGTRVTVSTLTSDRLLGLRELEADDRRWLTRFSTVGPVQPPPSEVQPSRHKDEEFLIQSRQGRYLWLRIELASDGYSTPVVGDLRIRFPRRSSLDFLPALYSAEEESRWFLERFLAIIERDWDGLGHAIDTIRRLFDPHAVPDEFVRYLADWLALPLEEAWTPAQQRRLLAAAPDYYPQRGTREGLRKTLQVYLWNMTGLPPQDQGELPAISEGFRERERLFLSTKGTARLGEGAPLWSRSQVGRLQLGVFGREGEVRLVSTGDPQRDLFHEFAHRFRVFVPAGWVQSDEDEAMLRRAIDADKPAHTQYELCLMEPRLRVGIQSTVGIDSVLGDYSEMRLACRDDETVRRLPRQRLGIDTVLAQPPGVGDALRLSTGDRVGIDTLLM